RPTVRGWTDDAGMGDAVSAARALADLGVSALLVTDVARDGAMTGPNVELLSALPAVFPGEILAPGGTRPGEAFMTVAVRVIPCLDVANGRVVKGVSFESLRDAADPVEAAIRYEAEGADELAFLDIAAAHEKRGTLVDLASRVAEVLSIPFTVGGGVRSVEDADALLRAGADRVTVNTAAVEDPSLITRLAEQFGAQCVVVAIDGKRVRDTGGLAVMRVMTHGGRRPTDRTVTGWAAAAAAAGAGEILLTSVDAD